MTGAEFASPVPPGSGWPGDPATPKTPVAHDAEDVERLAKGVDLPTLDARISVCRACPRLVEWREEVAHDKRASFRDEPYWGRPAPSFGDKHPQVLVIGLAPAAHWDSPIIGLVVLGALGVFDDKPRTLSPRDFMLLCHMADVVMPAARQQSANAPPDPAPDAPPPAPG